MNNVKSLRTGIFTEIIIVMIPLTVLLIYQTVSDIRKSDRIAAVYRVQAASSAARHKFKLFVNGAVDAVDTGMVAEDALNELKSAVKELSSIKVGERAREFAYLETRTATLHSSLRKDRSLQGLFPLRETINGIDQELAALDTRCEETSRALIQENVNSAQSRKKMVFAALLLGVLVTAFLIFKLIRHINQFERVLRESEERMRVMFESISAGIVLVDCATKNIADINPAALRMYGGAKQELVGQPFFNLFHSQDDTDCPVLKGTKGEVTRQTLNLHNGEQLAILRSVNNVTVNGRPYLLESFVDLSEQTVLEAELLSAKEAAEAANRAKSIFLASMSHEIRTPMNAILGYSQLLRREQDLTSQQGKYLGIINRSGEHLLKLINDILEMSKIEAGTVNHTRLPFSFHELLKDMESLFSGRPSQKRVRFSIDLNGDVPVALNADSGKVRQVLINVISNALKFTDRGWVAVCVSAAPDGAGATGGVTITIDVEDSGSGIAAEEFDKVFTSFEQTESGRHKIEGTGLGMPISRQFARLMGGDLILLRSEPGVGSVFRFTFQAEVVNRTACVRSVAAERCVRRIAPNEKEWRVLVVDDQETNRSLLLQVLTQAGFAVREAGDGIGGVEQFQAWSPDIVLMDIMMPGMDGYEAMRLIKATGVGNTTPVIAITASVLMEERQNALDHGFDGFIMKPVPLEYLFEEIRRLTNVAYLYEDMHHGGGEAAEDVGLTAESLSTLADNLLSDMRDALDAGDMAALRGLIERIDESEPALAEALRRLVDSYAYDRLATLFVKEEPHHVST